MAEEPTATADEAGPGPDSDSDEMKRTLGQSAEEAANQKSADEPADEELKRALEQSA